MKKLATIAVVFLLAAGLAAVGGPANAAYPAPAATYCSVHFQKSSMRYHHDNPVFFKVTTDGTAVPHRGTVRITAVSKKHTYVRSWDYRGGHHYHAFRSMRRGLYTVHMTYTSPNDSYTKCRDRGPSVRVR